MLQEKVLYGQLFSQKNLPTICEERADASLHDKIEASHDKFIIAYLSSPFPRHPKRILVCIHTGILLVRWRIVRCYRCPALHTRLYLKEIIMYESYTFT